MDGHNRPNILSIVWYKVLPAVMGGQKGIALFNQALARLAGVHCLCARNNEPGEHTPYPVMPELPVNKFQFISPRVHKKIFRAITQVRPTHLLIEHPYHGWAAIRAQKKFGLPFIVHEHNLEWLRFKTMRRTGWPLLKWYEGVVLRKAALVLFKTEEERRLAIQAHRIPEEKTMVTPYGTDLTAPPTPAEKARCRAFIAQAHHIPEHHRLLLFNGSFDYPPNEQALKNIMQRVIPLLQENDFPFTLVLCGNRLPHWFKTIPPSKHWVYAGCVPDIAPYYTGSDLLLNPVLTGGGIKTKLVEAIAHQLPVISTETGAAGMPRELCGALLTVCADGNW
ncbi:MAG: glycosyltransferase family 4 protein, partial [Dinghuibacter sp.]|nr:glycosyltransferase family 4 protein [Dinghuibacter sp.]